MLGKASTLTTRGATIETAASGIETRCNELPSLKVWDGPSHSAALRAFGRAKSQSIVVSDLADGLGRAITTGYWSLSTAKRNVTTKVAAIENGAFNVHDQWVVTLKPVEMTQQEAKDLLARRDRLQRELNPLVTAIGTADSTTAQGILDAATAQGFELEQPNVLGTLYGIHPPADDVPDPSSPLGLLRQQSIADADAALTVASVERGENSAGEPTTTILMQDGSKKVITQTTRKPDYGGTAVIEQQDFDPSGKLIATTSSFTYANGTKYTSIRYEQDQTLVTMHVSPSGETRGTVYPQGMYEQARPVPSEFFSHPALTSVGGVVSGVGQYADDVLKRPLPTLTTNSYQNLSGGMKYGGWALATGIALYDVSTAEDGPAACRAAISGTASAVGGWAGGAALSETGPIGVTLGAAGGSWLFGWVGSEIGKAVCY